MLSRRLTRLLTALPVVAALAAPALMPSTARAAAPGAAWTVPLGSNPLPTNGFSQPFSGPAVGNLSGSGPEIVTGSLDGWVRVFHSDSSLDWARNTGGAIQSSPTLADLRGNGQLEVIVTSMNGYVNAYNPNGSAYGGHWPQP